MGGGAGKLGMKGKQLCGVGGPSSLKKAGTIGLCAELSNLGGRTHRWKGRVGEQMWERGQQVWFKVGCHPLVRRGGIYVPGQLGGIRGRDWASEKAQEEMGARGPRGQEHSSRLRDPLKVTSSSLNLLREKRQ